MLQWETQLRADVLRLQLAQPVTCSGGSDWREIEILSIDVATGEPTKLRDKLEYVKFSSIAWPHDHKVGLRCMPAPFHHGHRPSTALIPERSAKKAPMLSRLHC